MYTTVKAAQELQVLMHSSLRSGLEEGGLNVHPEL